MASASNKYPDFFKVYLPDQHSQRMHIPIAFVNFLTRLQEWLPENVILRDHQSGRDWHVSVHSIGGKLYFGDGWKKFREENLLEAADFLVFAYDGTNLFEFKIYDKSGCEKIKEEEENVIENDPMMELEEWEEIKEEEEHDDEEEEDTEDSYCDYDDEDYFEDEEDIETVEENEEEYNGNVKRNSSTMDEYHKLEDAEAEAEMCVHPNNPYFIAKQLKTRPTVLHIPRAVIDDFSLRFPKKITLLCCNCQDIPKIEAQAYHVSQSSQETSEKEVSLRKQIERTKEVRKWKDGRVWVTGWKKFCKKNKIKENNLCICEIIVAEDQVVKILKVHVR